MPSTLYFRLLLLLLSSVLAGAHVPALSAKWANDVGTFRAGDIATIQITLHGGPVNRSEFSVSVGGRKGESPYVSGVKAEPGGDPTKWNVTMVPISVGEFLVVVAEERSGGFEASLRLSVVAGPICPSACIVSWTNNVNEFVAGTKASIVILAQDAFGNNISSSRDGPIAYNNFTMDAYHENTSIANISGFKFTGWDDLGFFHIEFTPITAGNLLLYVMGDNMTLRESPLQLNVKPGPLVVNKCLGSWKYDTNMLQIFSKLEFFIHQQDQFGNLVLRLYPFDARVVKRETNLSIPVADIFFTEFEPGIQLLSFEVSEPGEFMLHVVYGDGGEEILNSPYDYIVFVGYCHGSNSIVNGSGITASVAGRVTHFTAYLEDMYNNPSPVEKDQFHVRILRSNDSINVRPFIFPLRERDGDGPVPGSKLDQDKSASAFNVAYTPKVSGYYEIWVLCGNVPLNNGQAYRMIVSPGLVDTSLSRVVQYSPRVKRSAKNEIVVQLIDKFSNPTPFKEAQLGFDFAFSNSSRFSDWSFANHTDGLYKAIYVAQGLGMYNICVSVEDVHIPPCPFEINVYDREYFPEAHNDSISVWEDGSVAFDVLENDYSVDHKVSITNSSMPLHGSLLRYGQLFRYTPFKGFYGNDTFTYAISDQNLNDAVGTVLVSVLCLPPQFVSLPVQMQAIENNISPRFGGFQGFSIRYSDAVENISITLHSQSGTILLAPMPLQIWKPMGSELFVGKQSGDSRDLKLAGNVEVINSALQFIQYLGDENFYGDDVLTLHALNNNGKQDAHVPIVVEPINDPPTIRAPRFVSFDSKEMRESMPLFEKHVIEIGDPDLLNYPGKNSTFLVTLSVEVTEGLLKAILPDALLPSVELKLMKRHHWQHLQSFVTISNHFTVKARGVRIRGTIEECNTAMQQMLYEGMDRGDVLTIKVNDMGNYGICPDSTERTSLPYSAEAVVNLIKRKPVSHVTARFLATAIIVEFILMVLLGGILLFFICKCTGALHRERRTSRYFRDKTEDKSSKSSPSPASIECKTICSDTGSVRRFETSDIRQRSCRATKSEKSPSYNHEESSTRRCLSFSVEKPKIKCLSN